MRFLSAFLFALVFTRSLCAADKTYPATQQATQQTMQQAMQQTMPGMEMPDSPARGGMPVHPTTLIEEIEEHATSGTSAEPNSTPEAMLMRMQGRWMLMFHANGFFVDLQQESLRAPSGGRAGDKAFSTNWAMPMAQRELGTRGRLTLRAMFSLEPATIGDRRYPLLFQQGETAFGRPIADGQHPHNFVMEAAALYDLKLDPHSLFSLYAAPVGDPAIGPTAYPHRASALENPVAALGHHQQDSTHIADDVLTAGLTRDFEHAGVRVEASGFHGREPDENRWTVSAGTLDSWSTRVTIQLERNWSGQYSYARIASPEALFPAENQARATASLMYNRPWQHGNWVSTALWGRTRSLLDDDKANSYLLESALNFGANHVWTRIENAARTNELLNGEKPLPPGFVEQTIGHVQAYSFGYDHDLRQTVRLNSALGVQCTTYGVPGILEPLYGEHPIGVAVFLRVRPAAHRQLQLPQ